MKKRLLLWCFVVFCLVATAWSLSNIVVRTDKQSYHPGENVKLNITGLTNGFAIVIKGPDNSYTLDNPASQVIFKPQTVGNYDVCLSNLSSGDLTVVAQFSVISNKTILPLVKQQYSCTSKSAYLVGDRVAIYFNRTLNSVQLFSSTRDYEYSGDLSLPIVFIPSESGSYRVLALAGNANLSCSFGVTDVSAKASTAVQKGTVQPAQPASSGPPFSRETTRFTVKIGVVYGRKLPIVSQMNLELSNVSTRMLVNYTPSTGSRYDAQLALENSSISKIVFHDILLEQNMSIRIDEIPNTIPALPNIKWQKVFALDPSLLNFSSAVITSVAKGNALYKCQDWDFDGQVCDGTWQKMMNLVPGTAYNITINPADPAFGEANITILNVQSYPLVGDEWTVMFNTTGRATLAITPVNGTTWTGSSPQLQFLGIRCGNNTLQYSWVNTTVVLYNYTCPTIGFETSLELRPGKHTLRFQFGNAVAYAKNDATGAAMILFFNDTTIPTGWSCISCVATDPFYGRFPRGNATYGAPGGSTTHTHTIAMVSQTAGAGAQTTTSGSARSTRAHVHPSISATTIGAASNFPLYKALKVIRFDAGIPTVIPRGAIAVFNSSTLPSLWTRYAEEDGRFVLANNSVLQQGGSNNHTHSVQFTLDASGNTANSNSNGVSLATSGHTHSVSGTSNLKDNRPIYINVILARANSDTTLPRGMIAMFNASPSKTDWANMSSAGKQFFGRFIVGSPSYGATGGNTTHQNPDTNLSSGGPIGTTDDAAGTQWEATSTHIHWVTVSFSKVNNLPPFINVIFGYAKNGMAPPTVTLNYPRANYVNSTTTVTALTFNCSIKDDFASKNLSLFLTNRLNQSFHLNASCNLPKVNGSCKWQKNLLPGNYTWNCRGYDNSSIVNWAANRTIVITQLSPPLVELVTPRHKNFTASPASVYYNVTGTDLDQCQLWTNFSGTWKKNQTNISSSRFSMKVATPFKLKDGTYKWNAWCNDSNGLKAWHSTNFTFFVDSTLPSIKFTAVTPANNTYSSKNYIFINVSVFDLNLKNITFYLYNTTRLVNSTAKFGSSRNINFTNLVADKLYFFNVTVFDMSGNKNRTETRRITLDGTNPVSTLVGPENGLRYQTPGTYSVTFNCSITDSVASKNLSFYITDSKGLNYRSNGSCIIGSLPYCNWTRSLSVGNYSWNCLAYDKSARSDWDSNRSFFIGAGPYTNGYLILLWNGSGTLPAGWSCVSCAPTDPLYNRFVRGNSTFGAVGGSATHTHSLSLVAQTTGAQVRITATGSGKSTAIHVHPSISAVNVGSASNVPKYKALRFIRYKDGMPETLPAGVIAFFNTSSLPYGWVRYAVQDGQFVFANSSALQSGGANNHTHSVQFTLDASGDQQSTSGSGTSIANTAHTHSVSGTSAVGDNRPPFVQVVLARLASDSYVPSGMIGIFNASPPADWKNISKPGNPFYGRFVVGGASYGIIGGNISNHNPITNLTTGAASSATDDTASGSGVWQATGAHTHYVAVSFSDSVQLPPFVNVIFGYAKGKSPPRITLVLPGNFSVSPVLFKYNVTSSSINECQLWANFSAVWKKNQTNTSALTSIVVNKTFALKDGSYKWNVWCNDSSSLAGWAGPNRTLIVDSAFPHIWYTAVTPANNTYTSRRYLFINVSVSDTNEKNVTFFLYNLTKLYNLTAKPAGSRNINFTRIASNRVYLFNVTVYDKANNVNFTQTRRITFDNITPYIGFRSPTPANNTFSTLGYFYVNLSFADTNKANLTIYLYNISRKLVGANTTTYTKFNFTGLNPNSAYYYNVSVIDKAGNINKTQLRKITFDTIVPRISYSGGTAPNNSFSSKNYIYINVSVTEQNEKNITFYLFNTTQRVNATTKSAGARSINFTKLAVNKLYYYNVTVFDKIANKNVTITRRITLDTSAPVVLLRSPSPNYFSETPNATSILFNCSVTDNFGVKNLSLFLTRSNGKSFKLNASCVIWSTSGYCNWTRKLFGNYTWDCLAYDYAQNLAWGVNRTIMTGLVPPTITHVLAQPNSTGIGSRISLVANVTGLAKIKTVLALVTDPDSLVSWVALTNFSKDMFRYNYTAWKPGSYNFFIVANDTYGKSSQSGTLSFSANSTATLTMRTLNASYRQNSFVNLSNVTSSTWWNTSFTYRQKINLTVASGSTWRDFQVNIKLNSSIVGQNFDWSRSCADLRFTNGTNKAQIPYYVESCDSVHDNASVWVRVDVNISTSTRYIYMYYGNPAAQSQSNGNRVFDLFDDFEDGSLNTTKWTVVGGSVSELLGYVYTFTDNNGWRGIRSIMDVSRNMMVEFSFKVVGDRGGQATQYFGFINTVAGTPAGAAEALPAGTAHSGYGEGWCSDWGVCAEQSDGTTRQGAFTGFGGTPGKANEIYFPFARVNYTSAGTSFRLDYSNGTTYFGRQTSNTPNVRMDSFFAVDDDDANYGGIEMYVYWVRVRKSDSPEPKPIVKSEEKYYIGTMLKNNGLKNLSGYLLMQVKFLNSTWKTMSTVVNDSKTSTLRNIKPGSQLNIAPIWNANPWFTDSAPLGTYRAYGYLTDNLGKVLRNKDGTNVSGNFTFTLDYLKITVRSPLNNSVVDATGFWANLTLAYLTRPSGGWCGYSIDSKANTSMSKNASLTRFYAKTANVSVGAHNIRFYCNDTKDVFSSSDLLYITSADSSPPVVQLMAPTNNQEVPVGNVTFYYNVTDTVSTITNCTFEFNWADDQTRFSIKENARQNFTKTNLGVGTYYWRVYCADSSPLHNTAYSEYRQVIVGFDVDKPVVHLKEPVNGYNSSIFDINLYFRVDDATTSIKNCTLILNKKKNQTKTNIIEQGGFPYIFNNFTLTGLASRKYNWSVNCTDTSVNRNVGASERWDFTIYQDNDVPHIILVWPDDLYTSTSSSMSLSYNATDISSNIRNCSLFVNNRINQSQTSVSKGIIQQFQLNNLGDGKTYNWSVKCFDTSFQRNWNVSLTRKFTVYIAKYLHINVSANDRLYEKGTQQNESICINTTVADAYSVRKNASVATSIISGNTTHPWLNFSFKYRTPINITTTSRATPMGFQILLKFNASTVGSNFNWSRSCDDIRFGSQEVNRLAYYTENCNSTRRNASIWVRLDRNVTTKSYFIYMYYGNPTATSKSNPDEVFDLFDDFEDGTVDTNKWQDQWGGVTESLGYLYATVDNGGWRGVRSRTNFSVNSILEMQFRSVGRKDGQGTHYFGFYDANAANPVTPLSDALNRTIAHAGFGQGWCTGTGTWSTCAETANGTRRVGAYVGFAGQPVMPGTSYFSFAQVNYTTNGTGLYITNSSGGTFTRKYRNTTSTKSMDLFLGVEDHQGVVTNAMTMYVYWVRVRKYSFAKFFTKTKQEQMVINQSFKPSIGTNGNYGFCYDTSRMAYGWYSGASFAMSKSYYNATNATLFKVVADQTPPLVSLISPANNNISYTNNIVFKYNVSDLLSAVKNCSLLINSTLNQTNTSIVESQTLRFGISNMRSGSYNWTIRCYDDSVNHNVRIATQRKLIVAWDTIAPKVRLIAPKNNWNDTNGNLLLEYNVTDNIMSTADCTLYLNNTLNQTKTSLSTSAKRQNFTLTGMHDGRYSWFVNCSDTSTLRNYNISTVWNFTVRLDYSPPTVRLVSPLNNTQWTVGNLTLYYNVTDLISNITKCSLYVNNRKNQTNLTIKENQRMNFTLRRLNGWYNWSVNCSDGSENRNYQMSDRWRFLVATDVAGPSVNLVFPFDRMQLTPGNKTFYYNTTDFASGVANCSLYINNKRNQTRKPIVEARRLNMSVVLGNGNYLWYVNCTDDSANHNRGGSVIRNLTIGTDTTPPVITLISPVPPYIDTNGKLLLLYRTIDYGSGISNCTLVLNGVRNETKSKIRMNVNQNFSVTLSDGLYKWRVNCTDNSTNHNRGNSTIWNFTVTIDTVGPVVNLKSPPDNTVDTDGKRSFFYNVTDVISGIKNCSLIINGKYNLTNRTSIAQGKTYNFTLSNMANGQYNWSVNCTDNSENFNKAGSETRHLTVIKDSTPPKVMLISPPDAAVDTNGMRVFYFNVTDSQNNISSCTIRVGSTSVTNLSIRQAVNQTFTLSGLSSGTYRWNVTCLDSSDNANSATTASRTLFVRLDNSVPVISLKTPENLTQSISNDLVFFYNVTDISPIASCGLIINNTLNFTNSTVLRNVTQDYTIHLASGSYRWRVNCTDLSEGSFTGSSQERFLLVGQDLAGPVIYLVSPPKNAQTTSGNVMFMYNVTDFASGVENCSLVLNGKRNQTVKNPDETRNLNFSLTNLPNGNYTWRVNCTDNSINKNRAASELRNLTVGTDHTPPNIALVAPANNSVYNNKDVVFQFTANDYSSNISNCSLIIANRINQTYQIGKQSTFQSFLLYNVTDGIYLWSVNCTDSARNTGTSNIYKVNVKRPRSIITDVYADKSVYSQGQTARFTVNTSNATNRINTNVFVDIIRGNATAAWWNPSWRYRLPLWVNSTNISRSNTLMEYVLNFTKVITQDLGNATGRFDINSVRLIAWTQNKSVEVASQFESGYGYNKSRNAVGTISWIMDSIPSMSTRIYYLYFDIEQNGAKAATNYIKPAFAFAGNTKSVNYNGASQNSDRLTIISANRSFSIQFGNGQPIYNQQNIRFPGAGSIWNITLNRTGLMNYFSTIVPIAVYNNNYLNSNRTSRVTSGAVKSVVNIQGYLNSSPQSRAALNYTIWFAGTEIFVRANLVVQYAQANSNPVSLFNNLWFAYLMSNLSSWSTFIHRINSSSFLQNHDYHSPAALQDTTNQFNPSNYYAESWPSLGSVNLYSPSFLLNGLSSTTGIISYNDYYNPALNKRSESDGAGFNYNQDMAIALNDVYNITVWMVFSKTSSNIRVLSLKDVLVSPPRLQPKKAETFISRSSGASGVVGSYAFTWSTSNQRMGSYSVAGFTNKTYYSNGADYFLFQITPDSTPPTVFALTPSGWWNNSNVLFTYNASESNPPIAHCSLILNGRLNKTNTSITNNAKNYFRLILSEKDYNWSVNCTDSSGNTGSSLTKVFYLDIKKPSLVLNYPPPNALIAQNKIDFNFTATDNRAKNMTCDLFLNGALTRTIEAKNNTRTNITLNVSDGSYNWYVRCADWAKNMNISVARSLWIDTAAPTVQLISPLSPNNYDNDGNLTLVYKPYDTGGLRNCSLTLNGLFNQTNHTRLKNNANNNFSVTRLNQGTYNWSVSCTDLFSRVGSSTSALFYVDLYKPSVTLFNPLNGTVFNYSDIRFNYTVIDSFDKNLVCNLTIDSKQEKRNVASQNASVIPLWVYDIKDGSHQWNVSCWDHAGNKNTSQTRWFSVLELPIITLFAPKNNSWYNRQNITLFFNVSDSTGEKNCSLIFDGKINGTKTVIRNNRFNNFTRNYASETRHNWSVQCFDNSSFRLLARSSTWIFWMDFIRPQVSLYAPLNNTWNNSRQIKFAYSFVDANPNTCQLYSNFTGTWKRNATVYLPTSGVLSQFTTNVPDGTFKWNVRCNDSAGNFAYNNTNRTIKIDATAPIISLRRPKNKYWDSDGIVIFNFSLAEKNPQVCAVYTNLSGSWQKNDTLLSPVSGINTFRSFNLNEGFFKWNVWCNDSAKNAAWNATNSTFVVDKYNPHLVLNYPYNAANTSSAIYFNFTATDSVDKNLTCNLTLDNRVNQTKISAISAQFTTVYLQSLKTGYHNWSVICWDDALHYNRSSTLWFNVSIPDLIMLTSNILFSTAKPQENVNISVNATVLNRGGTNAYNVTVKFYQRQLGGVYSQINGPKIINISVNKNNSVSVIWTPKIGTYEIMVAADPANKIRELSELNNNATRQINVSLWHTIVGNTTGTLVIGDSSSNYAYSWDVTNSTTSNVFVADSDSVITWLKLYPISRNLSGDFRPKDFEKIDRAIGSRNLSDSVNKSYFKQGLTPVLQNFSIFKRLLVSVPVVNSTNSSTFTTGILWDSSDLARKDYNGTQDIVFLTKVLASTGNVQYQIRVPAYLRRYKSASITAVTFYTELK